ncbi:nucleoside phosphorylase domain-containing protein [Penicillium herquei]|nr:nucleoside phosphorylase domain-containing protein [Penicillium herquei]
MNSPQRSVADYTVGWICALPVELAAAKAILDEIHPRISRTDHGIYTLGALDGHNIVIACLPAGVYGTSSASIVATQMLHAFPSITFGLMVGIGGGVPSRKVDIRLGDVVVSRPVGSFGGVVQYDYGKEIGNGKIKHTGSLNKPPPFLLSAIGELEANHSIGFSEIPSYLSEMLKRHPAMRKFMYPGSQSDRLYEAEYYHIDSPDGTCSRCSKRHSVYRPARSSDEPAIHYGLIASGNKVMRDGVTRDQIAAELGGDVICFEMEAAGLMDTFPCIVIRGICDYADSHKSKSWQPYAAAVAAAYAKELLSVVPVRHQTSLPMEASPNDFTASISRETSSKVHKRQLPEDASFGSRDNSYRVSHFVLPQSLQTNAQSMDTILQSRQS